MTQKLLFVNSFLVKYKKTLTLLVHLNHSGDLLLWVGIHCYPSVNIFSRSTRPIFTKFWYMVMMTKVGSMKIVNFMTSTAGVLVLGHVHKSHIK